MRPPDLRAALPGASLYRTPPARDPDPSAAVALRKVAAPALLAYSAAFLLLVTAGRPFELSGAVVLALLLPVLHLAPVLPMAARRLGDRAPALLWIALAPLAPAIAAGAARAVDATFAGDDDSRAEWIHKLPPRHLLPEAALGLVAAPFVAWLAAGRPRSLAPRPVRALALCLLLPALAGTSWASLRATGRPAPDGYLASLPVLTAIEGQHAPHPGVIYWVHSDEERDQIERSTYARVGGLVVHFRPSWPGHVALRIEPELPGMEPVAESVALHSWGKAKTPSHLAVPEGAPITLRRDDRHGVLLVHAHPTSVRAFSWPGAAPIGFPPRAALGALCPPTSWLVAALASVLAAAWALLARRAEKDVPEDALDEARERARTIDAGRAAFAIAATVLGVAPLLGAASRGLF